MDSRSRRTAHRKGPATPLSVDRLPVPSTELAVQFGCLSARIRINPGPEGPLRAPPAVRPATATGREGRSGGELEQRLRRGPRRGHRRQPYPLQTGPDRGRIGPGGDDSQATATGRAFAEVGGKHPRQQGRPAQPMGAGRSARRAVLRRRLGTRLGRHDALAGPGPGARTPW